MKKLRLLLLIPVIGPMLLIHCIDRIHAGEGFNFFGGNVKFGFYTPKGWKYGGIHLLNVLAALALFIGVGFALRYHSFFIAWICISVFTFGPLTIAPALLFSKYAIKEEAEEMKEREANRRPMRNYWEEVQKTLKEREEVEPKDKKDN